MTNSANKRLVFQIGQNRTGSTSIYRFLGKCGLRAVHWDHGSLAATICENLKQSKPILTGPENYNCFTDMDPARDIQTLISQNKLTFENTTGWSKFKEFFAEYPDAYFILNVRPPKHWKKSLRKHFFH